MGEAKNIYFTCLNFNVLSVKKTKLFQNDDDSFESAGENPRRNRSDGQQSRHHHQGQTRHAQEVLQAHPTRCQDARQEEDSSREMVWKPQRHRDVRTVISHIENMMKGVTYGYRYKMKSVYAHFPINIAIQDDGQTVEVRNFLGEKYVRRVVMSEGVQCVQTGQKDEIAVEGNDLELVSQSAASIQQCVLVKHKDIRKFLDGIYVSEKETIEGEN